ncbi:MAG: hypothetical protein GEU95_10110 [Rhizobiales bacterium]|nr:hypothetical protein [Hyphomicrobiales bacterium]
MKTQLSLAICAAIALATGGAVSADPWKDESGRGRWRSEYRDYNRDAYAQQRREYKEEFYHQGCKVKRERKRDGSYKEEVECEGRR